jgi:hypothetical protein
MDNLRPSCKNLPANLFKGSAFFFTLAISFINSWNYVLFIRSSAEILVLHSNKVGFTNAKNHKFFSVKKLLSRNGIRVISWQGRLQVRKTRLVSGNQFTKDLEEGLL